MDADLILYNGLVTTLDRSNPSATAIAVGDGKFMAVGSDADIVVWDPAAHWQIAAATQAQRVDYNAYEGFEQIGRARDVFLRGRHIVQAGKIAAGPLGCYLPRKNRWQGEDAGCISSR